MKLKRKTRRETFMRLVNTSYHVTIRMKDTTFSTAVVYDRRLLASIFNDYLPGSGATEMNIQIKTKPVSMKTFLAKAKKKEIVYG